MSWPSSVAPLKNCTLLIDAPVAAVAAAAIETVSPGRNESPSRGDVTETFGGASTLTEMAVEVLVLLPLSVIFAVREYVPGRKAPR